MNTEAFILAGGASSRMGSDKAWLQIGGVPLVIRMANLLGNVAEQVTLIAPPNRFAELPLRVFADDEPDLGPLGGIATALRVSRADWNIVTGCDLPFLTGEWLTFLVERASKSKADAILPQSLQGHFEPLCAMYRTSARTAISDALRRGVRKVTDGLAALALEAIRVEEWKPFDTQGLLFKNMNAPEDYEHARVVLESEGSDVWLKGPLR